MAARIRDVVVAMALCHNVTPMLNEDGTITYQAASPDEVAIVRWTEKMGLRLAARDLSSMTLETDELELRFEILEVFPFTSETKRMGILVREGDTVMFYEKGADVVMGAIVQYNDWLDEECGNMAREGLRTLVVGRKRLTAAAYNEYCRRIMQAKTSVHERSTAIRTVVEQMLETDMELLGLTGVEDKLQEHVRSTLEQLRNAGLRIWMLTGDKVETAACVAVSCRLVTRNQQMHIAKGKTLD